jgi:Endoribonuclease L-PSP
MLAGNSKGEIVGDGDFDAQAVQVFANIGAALRSADAGWSNVVQFTTYLVHSQDIPKFMAFRLREFPENVYRRKVSSEYASDGRSPGEGAFSDRGSGHRGAVKSNPGNPPEVARGTRQPVRSRIIQVTPENRALIVGRSRDDRSSDCRA